jgi:hypothetical protein
MIITQHSETLDGITLNSERERRERDMARILRAIERVKGKEFADDVRVCASDGCTCHAMSLVGEPSGHFDFRGEYESFPEGYWVEQFTNSSESGDTYFGFVYIELKESRMYLKAEYYC